MLMDWARGPGGDRSIDDVCLGRICFSIEFAMCTFGEKQSKLIGRKEPFVQILVLALFPTLYVK
jgi:hypothetical protein